MDYLEVLRYPVIDVKAQCDDIDIVPFGPVRQLHHLLVELVNMTPLQYRLEIISWMKWYSAHLDMAYTWCKAHGQYFMEYQSHLGDGGPADGLEVLLALLAIDIPINVIMRDTVWSTVKDGPDFHHSTVVLCSGGAVPCRPTVSDQGHLANMDTISSSNINESVMDEDRVPEALLN